MKILICGHRSYAARNFKEKLEQAGYEVWCFSRGSVKESGKVVTGPVLEMDSNPFLQNVSLDVVVNFILLDGQSVEENIQYVDSLCKCCVNAGVKRLIHMSSISVLPNSVTQIDEDTPIDSHPEYKGSYGAVKIAVDNRLLYWEKRNCFQVIFMRPGFITASDKKNALAGIAKLLPGNIAILMGNNQSTLPTIDRDKLQRGILNAIETDEPLKVYLMVEKGDTTKRGYLQGLVPHAKVIALPKTLVMMAAKILELLRVFDRRKVEMVAGQFKVQRFNAERTFNKINS